MKTGINRIKKYYSTKTALSLGIILFFSQIPDTVEAGYWGMVKSPDWQDSEGYTRQSWGFSARPDWQQTDLDNDGDNDVYLVNDPGYRADIDMCNDYGGAFFIRSDFNDAFAWDWMDQGPMKQDWKGLQGMIGGMGNGTLDFRVHGRKSSGKDRQIWIQYVVYISNGIDPSAMETVISTSPDFAARQGAMADKKWDRIARLDDRGISGQWWRVTEMWRISTPGTVDYIRIRTSPGAVNIIDSVDIVTRTPGVAPGKDKKGDYK